MKTQLQLDSEWSNAREAGEAGEAGEVTAEREECGSRQRGGGATDLTLSGALGGAVLEGGPFRETGVPFGASDFAKRCQHPLRVASGRAPLGGAQGKERSDGLEAERLQGQAGADGSPANGTPQRLAEKEAEKEAESDESVLKRLNDGEQRAMGELWGRYAGLLFSQALQILHNATEAEDVVVEVFSEVWRRAGGYHPERARPAAWLVTLVRRRAIDRFRERRSHERAEERLALERGRAGDASDGTTEQVRIVELRRLLEQVLARLPERQREAVCLVYFEGLTQREISKKTRTPIGTVKTRLELGLRKMRERIRGASFRPRTEEFCSEGGCFCQSTEEQIHFGQSRGGGAGGPVAGGMQEAAVKKSGMTF
jgi:RNA polymerase sigma-70 factor (ECF subfamily)